MSNKNEILKVALGLAHKLHSLTNQFGPMDVPRQFIRKPIAGMPPKRISIIGSGRITWDHLTVLRNFKDIDIISISNRGNTDLGPIRQEFSIPNGYTDWQKMLDTERPDAVFNLVGVGGIYEVTKGILNRKIPCFLEKPPGMSCQETKELAELADLHGILNQVGFNRRYYSVIEQSMNIITKHGNFRGISADIPENIIDQRRKGKYSSNILENWMIANSIHAIDLCNFLMGEVNDLKIFKKNWDGKDAQSFWVMFKNRSGATAQYISNWNSAGKWKLTLYGEGICVDFTHNFTKATAKFLNGSEKEIPPAQEDQIFKPGIFRQDFDFINSLISGNPLSRNCCDLNDAINTMALIEKIRV